MLFFKSITVLPLANASAIFFISPVLITLPSVPLLGEAQIETKLLAFCLDLLGL
tara:strand:+ start:521 stop:682 length:162 start_codon:yes stop_codon:yes gene_type:complete